MYIEKINEGELEGMYLVVANINGVEASGTGLTFASAIMDCLGLNY